MYKQKLINQAIELLKKVDVDELENVQINTYDYDDSSQGLTIELTYSSTGFIKPEVTI